MRHEDIAIGERYFLSHIGRCGSWVLVLSISTEINAAGWATSIVVTVLETVGDLADVREAHRVGARLTVNASNLYRSPEDVP